MKDYLKELKQFLKLGIPIYGSQASYAAMGLTDTIVAGRAGAVELSGVAIGSSVANPLFFSLSGLMFAITPIVAHLFGAKQLKDISLKMKEVIWIALGVGLILTLAYPLAGSLLRFSSIDKEILEVTFGYLSALSIGATAIVLFTALRCFSEGITQTRPVFLGRFHWDVSQYSIRYYFGQWLFWFTETGWYWMWVSNFICFYCDVDLHDDRDSKR